MNEPMTIPKQQAERLALELLDVLSIGGGDANGALHLPTVQRLLAALVKTYAECLLSEDESGDVAGMEVPSPFPDNHPVTATEVLMVASGMLRAVNLNVFELGLWENIGRYR